MKPERKKAILESADELFKDEKSMKELEDFIGVDTSKQSESIGFSDPDDTKLARAAMLSAVANAHDDSMRLGKILAAGGFTPTIEETMALLVLACDLLRLNVEDDEEADIMLAGIAALGKRVLISDEKMAKAAEHTTRIASELGKTPSVNINMVGPLARALERAAVELATANAKKN